MRYVVARVQSERREEAYRIYVTDGLMALSKTLARAENMYINTRLNDMLNPKPEDKRTFREIVKDVWRNIRGE